MEIRETFTFDDKVDEAIALRKISGLLARDNLRRRIFYGIFTAGFLVFTVLFAKDGYVASAVVNGAFVLFGLYNIVFAQRVNVFNIRRNSKRNMRALTKKYGPDIEKPRESVIRISDGFAEVEVDGSVTRWPAKDFVRDFDEGKFHVFEFTCGRYIFVRRESLGGQVVLDEAVAALRGGVSEE